MLFHALVKCFFFFLDQSESLLFVVGCGQVVRMVETYDTTTIRASTPMFLMARKIKAMGVKMVLSGEGADEVSQPVTRHTCHLFSSPLHPRRDGQKAAL